MLRQWMTIFERQTFVNVRFLSTRKYKGKFNKSKAKFADVDDEDDLDELNREFKETVSVRPDKSPLLKQRRRLVLQSPNEVMCFLFVIYCYIVMSEIYCIFLHKVSIVTEFKDSGFI